MILWLLSSNKETLLYFLGTSCSSNSYTQSYTLHQVIIDSKPLTKLLIAAQIFDGVAEVRMSPLYLLTRKHNFSFWESVVVLILILNHTHDI